MDDIKNWLLRYGEQQRLLDTLYDRRELLRYKVNGARTTKVDGLPHGTPHESDVIGDMVAALEELESEVAAERARGRDLYHEIETGIREIKGRGFPERRAVLRLRYLDLQSWPDTIFVLFGRNSDFETRYDSFQRRAYQIHSDALKALAQIVYPTIKEK